MDNGAVICNDERRLASKIYYFEDMLLRCKNTQKAEQISIELNKLRRNLSRLRMGS